MSNSYGPTDFKMTGIDALQQLEATPWGDYPLPASTYAMLQGAAESFGDGIALRFLAQGTPEEDCQAYTFKELLSCVTQTANALHGLGVGATDCVSMLLPNLPQTVFAIWGSEAAGIFNPINPLLETEHVAALLNEVHCPVLITLAPLPGNDIWQKAQALIESVPSLHTLITVDMAPLLPAEAQQAVRSQRPDYLQPLHRADGSAVKVLDFDALIASQVDSELVSGRQIGSDDIASYFHTGGTTGTPKLAPHTHANEVACAFQINTALDTEAGNVTLVGLPLFHVNAVFTTLSAWLSGAGILLGTPQGYRSPLLMENFWPLVEKYQVTAFSAVPTILSGLLNFPTEGHDLSSLKYALCGAAPLASELANQFEKKTGLTLLEGYGQTEGTCATTISPRYGDHRIGSVGCRMPYMGLRIVEIDEKTGQWVRDCDVGEAGVVAISGPNVFAGYKQPEHNVGQWVEAGWFNTGDLGRLDEDGFLWLTGRSKDVIIRGGHNIDPQMIEEVYFKHEAVADVAAIGKPDARVGELPVAFIQLKKGCTASEAELLAFGQEHIHERAAVPKEIFIVEALPCTAVGKIFKPDLRNAVVDQLVREELTAIGVEAFELNVQIDKKFGQWVTVNLPSEQNAETVRETLGRYAFKTTVNV
ncbi:acyl-CoA synthetase [Aestuariicella hydrocarbonica]|uniref:Acyl-CoA synthetase n=1 Tax=Pseudomaricurvus hydrocarbonicus TaxID=1470433 RepID=A0A9E5MGF7_9GAMM|nr:acyl-CoA synthetase [Aestuariicella hydrocarbonica]NHO64596.1 acyl-CoA synthetase [Aestuariicella hydrocarbonica]